MTDTFQLGESLRKELEVLEERLRKTEEKFESKPPWYRKAYGDPRLQKIRAKIDHVKDGLKSVKLAKEMEAHLAVAYPTVTRLLRRNGL